MTQPTTTPTTRGFDPALDLVLERVVDVRPDLVWKAWTTPDLLKRWFTPAPWTTADIALDLRPGGLFRAVMRSPEGQDFPNDSCILEVTPTSRLVWTTALGGGFRPVAPKVPPGDALSFTAVISIEPHGAGTRYRAHLMHADPATRERHGAMGFESGWGAAFDQLVAMVRASG
jgi:uncharacterized protein YndB with AHSA1/START domain